MLGAVVVFLLGSLTTVALTQQGRARTVAGAALIGLGLLLTSGGAFAHGSEDHSHGEEDKDKAPAAAAPMAMTGTGTGASESPRRLPDGSLYVPKPSQRLLSIRTTVAKPQEAAQTVQLSGQIVADPNGGGHVHHLRSHHFLLAMQQLAGPAVGLLSSDANMRMSCPVGTSPPGTFST